MRQGSSLQIALLGSLLALPSFALAQDGDAALERAKELEKSIISVVKKISPAYVVIGGGSGVIISPDGWILTNHHVAGSRRRVGADWRIKRPGGRIHLAKLVGTDPQGDIALLKIHDATGPLPFVPMADSSRCQVGDVVIALGNPFGFAKDATPTVTMGLISALHRYRGNYGNAIQTDAAINPGNSGGPLLDIQGRLVGINGSITTRHGVKINSGAGYAIPTNQIKNFLGRLKAGGVVAHARIRGLAVANSSNGGDGAVVTSVEAGSTASRFGLKTGDHIVAVDGIKVFSQQRFLSVISTIPSATTISLTLLRKGESLSLKGRLDDAFRAGKGAGPSAYFGVRVRRAHGGLEVIEIVPEGPAAKAGITKGDILRAIDEAEVDQTYLFLQQLRAHRKGDKIQVRVERDGTNKVIPVTLSAKP